MSIQKQSSPAPRQEWALKDKPRQDWPLKEKDYRVERYQKHQKKGLSKGVEGINSSTDHYFLSLVGDSTAGNLWQLNLSTLPGQKRLMTLSGATTFLINYPEVTFPSRISLLVMELAGGINEIGTQNHVVGVLVPYGAPSAVSNPGGIIGYNLSYKLLGQPCVYDISGLPVLTFNLGLGHDLTPPTYPIQQAIQLGLNITNVML